MLKTMIIRPASLEDIPSLVNLSYQKRCFYEKAQPQFWKYAGIQAEIAQSKYFKDLIKSNDHIFLTAENKSKISGFIIGNLIKAPAVYAPIGLTLMIDDFCVDHEDKWKKTGRWLLKELREISKKKGASQVVVVCGQHDKHKKNFLATEKLSVVSLWYRAEI